eukprot:5909560-Prymnesium_polylepis.1
MPPANNKEKQLLEDAKKAKAAAEEHRDTPEKKSARYTWHLMSAAHALNKHPAHASWHPRGQPASKGWFGGLVPLVLECPLP